MEFLGYLAAIFMGISLGLIGGGGSILTVPILVYLFKQDPLIATTGSLFVVGTTAFVGAALNARKKIVDFKTGVLFAIPSFAGVFVARHFVLPNIPNHIVSVGALTLTKPLLVMGTFGIIMLLASRAMIQSGGSSSPPAPLSDSKKNGLLAIVWQGFLIGITTGFVGAGGGFLIIPALVLLLKLPMKTAVGTSLAIIAANSLFGFTISIESQSFEWPLLFKISAIGIVGIAIGQFYASKVNEKLLKRGFGYFVLVIGSLVLLDQITRLNSCRACEAAQTLRPRSINLYPHRKLHSLRTNRAPAITIAKRAIDGPTFIRMSVCRVIFPLSPTLSIVRLRKAEHSANR